MCKVSNCRRKNCSCKKNNKFILKVEDYKYIGNILCLVIKDDNGIMYRGSLTKI
jgi:hypothetical protein